MPVFNDYSQGGELLQSRNEMLNSDNLARYIQENGAEMTKGYLEGIQDMLTVMDDILFAWNARRDGGHPNSPSIVRTRTQKLFDERSAFLEFGKKFIEDATGKSKQDSTPEIK